MATEDINHFCISFNDNFYQMMEIFCFSLQNNREQKLKSKKGSVLGWGVGERKGKIVKLLQN